MKTVSIDVEIDQEVLARLSRLSEQRHCSTQSLAQAAVIQYLEREERSERERLEDLARWRRYEDTGECLSQKDMTDWLESKAREAGELARER
jgi:predicted transcriptional regulator